MIQPTNTIQNSTDLRGDLFLIVQQQPICFAKRQNPSSEGLFGIYLRPFPDANAQ